MNYSRTLIILTICFLIVVIIACARQPFTNTHPKIIQVRHVSQSMYTLNNPTNVPMIIPISSQTASITVQSFDELILSPTLEEISRKIGRALTNGSCLTQTKCSFDDTFNRKMAFTEVKLTSMQTPNNYRFTFQHLPSYQIEVSSISVDKIIVQDALIKPRTETVVDIQSLSIYSSFDFKITIERCDLNDSPFLLSLVQKLPYIVMWGTGRCHTLQDTLLLTVNR